MAGFKKDFLFRFLGDSKQLERAASRSSASLNSMTGKVSKGNKALGLLGGTAGKVGALIGAGAFVSGVNSAINAASDFDESINAVNVATGDAAPAIMKIGETAAQSLGMSKTAVNEAAVAFSAFGEKIDSTDVAGTFEDYIGRAVDFASVMNLDVDSAITKFRSGLAGESEPLRAFGIDLSAAAVGAHAVSKGIAESASSMTEAQKVQARYSLLMEQTSKVAGDFANTSDGLANQQRILSAEWENAQIEIGKNLVPVMTKLVGILSDLAGLIPGLVANFEKGIQAMSKFGQAALEVFGLAEWDFDDQALLNFQMKVEGATAALEGGRDPLLVAQDLMVGLTQEMALSAEQFERIQELTGVTDEELLRVAKSAKTLGDEFDFAAGSGFAFENEIDRLSRKLDRDLVTSTEDAAEAARDHAYETMQTARAAQEAEAAVDDLHNSFRELVDPVFKAERAQADYTRTLEQIQEDGVVTAEELQTLTDKFIALEDANANVSSENIEAYRDKATEALGDVTVAVDDQVLALDSIYAQNVPVVDQLNQVVDRVERIAGKKISVDLSSLKVATQADLEQAITRVLYQLQKSGKIQNIYL